METEAETLPVVDTEVATEPQVTGADLRVRLLAAASLALTVVAVGWGIRAAYSALTDAWVAPLRLSPDNDKVLLLRVEDARRVAERGRLVSEVSALQEELAAIDIGEKKLLGLAGTYSSALDWSLHSHHDEVRVLSERVTNLKQQEERLATILTEQKALFEAAESDSRAGLITGTALRRETVALHQAELALSDVRRDLTEATALLTAARSRTQALSSAKTAGTSDAPAGTAAARGTSPDVLAHDEHTVRLELELARLGAERRSADARLRSTRDALAAMDELLAELRARPLYRAMQHTTDLAFLPYAHFDRVEVGNDVVHCDWVVFGCKTVGSVSEIVSGEVVTQDPWGELARGQYVVLALSDDRAPLANVLRVRPKHGD